jgi:hypothetical protein
LASDGSKESLESSGALGNGPHFSHKPVAQATSGGKIRSTLKKDTEYLYLESGSSAARNYLGKRKIDHKGTRLASLAGI